MLREEVEVHTHYPYVLTGYRPSLSYIECMYSLFYLHNETLNCYTMILGNVLVLILTLVLQPCLLWIGWLVCISSWIHLPFSLGFHLFRCKDCSTAHRWKQLDRCAVYVGCPFLCYALGNSLIPYFMVYMTIVCIGSVYGIHQILMLKQTQTFSKLNSILLISIPFVSCLFPMMYSCIMSYEMFSLITTGTLLASYVFGTVIYAFSIPERWFPFTFDYFHSHVWMHLMLISGHISMFFFVYNK